MSVQIQVNDRSDNPKGNYQVAVKWSDGRSDGRTDNNGVYDTGVSGGTIESVTVYGEQVLGRRKCGSNDFITVNTTK